MRGLADSLARSTGCTERAPLKAMMTITIRFFAILRDRAGTSVTTMQFHEGTNIFQASEKLAERYPGIAPHLSKVAFALNEHYVSPATDLHDSDELALIPPVSGG
jgi:molybdopterin converting factor subunit 1